MDLKVTTSKIDKILLEKGITKAAYSVSESETRELNAEQGEFSLYRTLFTYAFSVTVFKDGKMGTSAGTDLYDESIESIIQSAIDSAESAEADEAYDIAPKQENEVIRKGACDYDMDKFYDRVDELLQTVKCEYPKIQVMNVYAKHIKNHEIYKNTNGTEFEIIKGRYGLTFQYAGNDGEKTTGIDGMSIAFTGLDRPLIELGNMRNSLETAQNLLNLTKLEGKFTGKVIFTPDCFGEFMSYVVGNYVSDGVMLDGTSLWKDKLGEKVAADKLTFAINPRDKRMVAVSEYTGDGFRADDMVVIEKGILKNHQLSLYVANKLGRKPAPNTDDTFVVEPGDKSLSEMIKSIDKGLIVGGFSGGHPTSNGEFSGVAKKSFYIENGEIKGAVEETMISGNLGEMLLNIVDISKEVVEDGFSVLPYVQVDGIVISAH